MQTSHEKNDEILCTPRNLKYQPYTIHRERRKPSKNSAHPFPPNLFYPFSFFMALSARLENSPFTTNVIRINHV